MINCLDIVFCTYFKNIEKFIYRSESYEEYTAFCLIKGSFRYRIGGETEESITAPAAVICPPNTPFEREIIEPAELCMIKFTCAGQFSCIKTTIVPEIQRFIYNMNRLADCVFEHHNMTELHRHFSADTIYMLASADDIHSPIHDAIRYVGENITKDLSVRFLAEKSGYSETHFINLFKSHVGETPKNHVIKARIKLAKQILCFTNKSIKETAILCGFSDEYYFCRIFKKYENCSPSVYRKLNR
jgi:AraC-like DNA-binding protein